MAVPVVSVWGALLGWFLMPRIRKTRGIRAFRPAGAYISALIIAVAVMYCFEYHRQAWFFVLGMIVQLAVFVVVAWWRSINTGSGHK
jgi:hypothetical protein